MTVLPELRVYVPKSLNIILDFAGKPGFRPDVILTPAIVSDVQQQPDELIFPVSQSTEAGIFTATTVCRRCPAQPLQQDIRLFAPSFYLFNAGTTLDICVLCRPVLGKRRLCTLVPPRTYEQLTPEEKKVFDQLNLSKR